MTPKSSLLQNPRFKISHVILVVLAGLMTLNHLFLIFFLDDEILFIGYTAFCLYALIVILIPFQRIEKWAWWVTWIFPIGLALPAAGDPNLMIFYFVVSFICGIGLFLTLPEFYPNKKGRSES